MKKTISQLAESNPCIRFILDNYDMLCAVHRGKTVLAVGKYVARTFPSMYEAFLYTDALNMENEPYAMIECNGGKPEDKILISKACSRS